MNYTSIYIIQNNIIMGIIYNNITYTITRNTNNSIFIDGNAERLCLPSKNKHIYDANEISLFDIVIKRDKLLILNNVYIVPDTYYSYIWKDTIILDNFKFQSW